MPAPKSNTNSLTKTGEKTITGKVIGRDKTVVPPEEVFKLAQLGCKDNEIADWFGINSNTLRYQFSTELLKGREALKQSLRRAQIEVALGGNSTMLIWLGKNILGQSDNPVDLDKPTVLPWISEQLQDHKTELEDQEILPESE